MGAGFGGLRAARGLAGAPVDVLLLDRHNYHLFQPLLYQVATAGLSPEEIAYPVRAILRSQKNFSFRMAEVTGIDPDGKAVLLGEERIPYDHLILAAGSRTSFFGLESVRSHGHGLKDLKDAVVVRNEILLRLEQAAGEADAERRRALLSFVVVGGGPTGVEMAGALAELLKIALRRDHPSLPNEETRIHLLEAADRILLGFPEDLARRAARVLAKRRVEVRTGCKVLGFDGSRVEVAGGPPIPAASLLWTAGVEAVPLAWMLGLPPGPGRRVRVTPTLQVPGRPEVFVIGDAAYVETDGTPAPMVAPAAIQMGETAAANVIRALAGEPLAPFRYADKGSLATIGRTAAVAHVGGLEFHGFVAWVAWLFVHLIQLIGFRNRLAVLADWAWSYLLYERAVRIITRD